MGRDAYVSYVISESVATQILAVHLFRDHCTVTPIHKIVDFKTTDFADIAFFVIKNGRPQQTFWSLPALKQLTKCYYAGGIVNVMAFPSCCVAGNGSVYFGHDCCFDDYSNSYLPLLGCVSLCFAHIYIVSVCLPFCQPVCLFFILPPPPSNVTTARSEFPPSGVVEMISYLFSKKNWGGGRYFHAW